MFMLDWLHVMDLGVANNFLANLFSVVIAKLPGAALKDRCSAFFVQTQAYYQRYDIQSRLDNLTPTMLKSDKKGYKLRAKGAEARGLIQFGEQMALQHLDSTVPMESAAKEAAVQLSAVHKNLAKRPSTL